MRQELAKPRLYTVVVNEMSGGGRAARELPKVVRYLRDHLPTAEVNVIRSASYHDAAQTLKTAALAARPGDAVVAMGGDGMAHLGLNACAHTDAVLGIIPAGTGNDFARAVGIPKSVKLAVEAIARGTTRTVDLMKLSGGERTSRRVGGVVSCGYDALVNRAANALRINMGALSYGWVALRELRVFDPLDFELVIDGVEHEHTGMLVAVSNTGVFGGGMRIAPDADPSDGWLDITMVETVPRTTLLRLLPFLYTGGFVSHPAVKLARAKQVEMAGQDLFIMGDGEEMGNVPVTVSCDPGSLRVFVGDD